MSLGGTISLLMTALAGLIAAVAAFLLGRGRQRRSVEAGAEERVESRQREIRREADEKTDSLSEAQFLEKWKRNSGGRGDGT